MIISKEPLNRRSPYCRGYGPGCLILPYMMKRATVPIQKNNGCLQYTVEVSEQPQRQSTTRTKTNRTKNPSKNLAINETVRFGRRERPRHSDSKNSYPKTITLFKNRYYLLSFLILRPNIHDFRRFVCNASSSGQPESRLTKESVHSVDWNR